MVIDRNVLPTEFYSRFLILVNRAAALFWMHVTRLLTSSNKVFENEESNLLSPPNILLNFENSRKLIQTFLLPLSYFT